MCPMSKGTLQRHLYDVHRNMSALNLSDGEAFSQHHAEHRGTCGLRYYHDHMELLHPLIASDASGIHKPFAASHAKEEALSQYLTARKSRATRRGNPGKAARAMAALRILHRHRLCSDEHCAGGDCHTCVTLWPCPEIRDLAAGFGWKL
jgi:hypothetical protein